MDFLFVYTYIYIYLHMSTYLYIHMYISIYLFVFSRGITMSVQVILNAFSIGCHTLHTRPAHGLLFVMLAMSFHQSKKFNEFENFR